MHVLGVFVAFFVLSKHALFIVICAVNMLGLCELFNKELNRNMHS